MAHPEVLWSLIQVEVAIPECKKYYYLHINSQRHTYQLLFEYFTDVLTCKKHFDVVKVELFPTLQLFRQLNIGYTLQCINTGMCLNGTRDAMYFIQWVV